VDASSRLIDVVVLLSSWPQAGFLETIDESSDEGRLLLSRDSNDRASALVWVAEELTDPLMLVDAISQLAHADRQDLRYLATTDGRGWRWLRWTGEAASPVPDASMDWAVCPSCSKRAVRTTRLKSSFSSDAKFVVCEGDQGPFCLPDGSRCLELDSLSYAEESLAFYLRCMECGHRFSFPTEVLKGVVRRFPPRDMTTDLQPAPDVVEFFATLTGRDIASFDKGSLTDWMIAALCAPIETECTLQSEWVDENAGFDFSDSWGDLPMPALDDLEGWSRLHDAYEVDGGNILLWAVYTADN